MTALPPSTFISVAVMKSAIDRAGWTDVRGHGIAMQALKEALANNAAQPGANAGLIERLRDNASVLNDHKNLPSFQALVADLHEAASALSSAPPVGASVPDLEGLPQRLRAAIRSYYETGALGEPPKLLEDAANAIAALFAKSRADGERIGVLVEELEKARQLVQLAHEQGAFKNSEQVHSLLNDGLWSIDAAIKRAKS